MKIVQSFWMGNNSDMKKTFGWLSNKYHYLSWILSANQLRHFYDEVELFTDKCGYEILINKLQLPYTKVHVVLDELNSYDVNLWALAKIKTYSLFNESFLHVDGDVFIWKAFDKNLLSKDLITQNIETTTEYYREMWNNIYQHLNYLPYPMESYHKELSNKSYNMGIFGGNDIEFIRKYTAESFHFVETNNESAVKTNMYNFNMFFEQVLFYEMTKLENKKVSCLINKDIKDNGYDNDFANFDEVPNYRTYLHILGYLKRIQLVCIKLEIYVQKYYPEYYERVENLLDITPKLSTFGYTYSKNNNIEYEKSYIKQLLNKDENKSKAEQIFSRNITMEGKIEVFNNLLKNDNDFILIPTGNFNIKEEKGLNILEIIQIENKSIIIPLFHIDEVIFNELDGNKDNKDFERNAIQYLQEDFPVNEHINYIATLWKRVSYFISLGIFLPVNKKLYQKINKNKDKADA